MKVLVTGSAGRLGQAIIELLRFKKIQSIGIDLLKSKTTDIVLDIRNKKDVANVIKKVDRVIHTAAVHGRHLDMNLPRIDFIETNILGTLHLLEASAQNGIKSFIYTSTTSVYGKSMENANNAVWVDEQLPAVPRDIYDISKLTAENLCRDSFAKDKLNCCVLRVSRFMDEPKNEIANYRLYRGLDEKDGAEAHLLAVHRQFKTFEIFNISNDTPFKMTDLKTLKNNPKKVIVKYYPTSEDIYAKRGWTFPKSIDRVYSIDKAKKHLHYQPKNNFLEYISSD